jgi:putative hydrolase of the HAD superfamily
MIRLVTFDFWETLVADSAENLRRQRVLRIDALVRALARAEAGLAPAGVEAAYERSEAVLTERFWGRDRDLASRDQVRIVLECAAPGAADRLTAAAFDELVAGYIEPVLAHPPELSPGAAEAVRALASRGITLGIISNTGRTPGVILRRVLEAHDLLRHFSVIAYSDEVGYRKPDAEIFRRTLAGAGAAPGEAAHVGDNPIADVAGARGVGMLGVHYAAAGRPGAEHADLIVADLAEIPARLAGR